MALNKVTYVDGVTVIEAQNLNDIQDEIIQNASDISGKQATLSFDATPTNGSSNPVTSDGIYDALATKQDTLTFDDSPTQSSTNPVKSGGVYTEISSLSSRIATVTSEEQVAAEFTVVANQYVKGDGSFASYNNWSRTDYIPVTPGSTITISISEGSAYNFSYDSNKNPIGSKWSTTTGTHTKTLDANTYYVVFSGKTASINALIVWTSTQIILKPSLPLTEKMHEEVSDINASITGKDGASGLSTDALLYLSRMPSYYTDVATTPSTFAEAQSYIDNKIASIPKDGKSFIFITDVHIDGNAGHSTELINYIRKRTGITKVLFGGDVFGYAATPYLAKKKAAIWLNEIRRAVGKDFIPCVGDHDNNTVSVTGVFLPYSQIEDLFVGDLERAGYHWYDASTKLANYATVGSENYNEAMSFFHTVFYVDDISQGIRYISLNCGNGGGEGAMYNIFGDSGTSLLRLQFDWLAETMMSTPTGYDIVVLSHKGNTNDGGVAANALRIIMNGFKNKNESCYPHPSSAQLANIDAWWPNTTTYNFSAAPDVGYVIALNGHKHIDSLTWFGYLNGEWSYTTPMTSGDTIIQPDTGGATTCQTPVIITSCDSIGVVDASSPSMTSGTVTEQCFDVITLVDDGIVMTRIGAGDDRRIYINKT